MLFQLWIGAIQQKEDPTGASSILTKSNFLKLIDAYYRPLQTLNDSHHSEGFRINDVGHRIVPTMVKFASGSATRWPRKEEEEWINEIWRHFETNCYNVGSARTKWDSSRTNLP